jgi:hypothetical protein
MEEALLMRHFGDAYRAYRARTRKLVPFLQLEHSRPRHHTILLMEESA